MRNEAKYEVLKKNSMTNEKLIKIRKQKVELFFLKYRRIRKGLSISALQKDNFNSIFIG